MIPIKDLLDKFSIFLLSSWENLSSIFENDSSGSLKADWLQANWELIVEGLSSDKKFVLEPYGDGADCNGASSRVLYPDRIPTHKLVCEALNNELVYDVLNDQQLDLSKSEFIFDRFVSIGEDGWYYETPPFDKVLGEYEGKIAVLNFHEIDVKLLPIEETVGR